jgi:hypothetical protein
MLLMNQQLGKLAGSCVDFAKHGMLEGMCLYLAWEQILRMFSNHLLTFFRANITCIC